MDDIDIVADLLDLYARKTAEGVTPGDGQAPGDLLRALSEADFDPYAAFDAVTP